MPSTYSPSLKLELIGNGEQAGTWGTTTNNNLGVLLEQAITGVLPLTLTGDVTLTDYNGLSDQARNAVLMLNGLLGAPCNVIVPPSQKVYIVRNFSNATVTIKTSSGNGVALTNAASAVVFCDGSNVYSATTLNFIDGNLTVTGTTTLGDVLTCNSSVVLKGDVYGNVNTGQWYLPTGTGAQRTASPINGMIRYNTDVNGSDTGFYEGYKNGVWIKFLTANQGNYTISYVAVGGGAGGALGGGGGGQFSSGSWVITPTTVVTVTVGGGGSSGTGGSSSIIAGVVTASGGGAASGFTGGTSGNSYAGGGSSGGGSGSGGGGGATAVGGGGADSPPDGGGGGAGAQTLITGSSVYYGGGGGGYAGNGGTPGSGGNGGGGGGGSYTAVGPSYSAGTNGSTNTGGGGGGAPGPASPSTSSGGSGRVILAVPTTSYTGTTTGSPTITTSGSNTILVYNSSGTYTA